MDPTAPLTPSGNLRRRLIVSRAMRAVATGAALIAVAALVILTIAVVARGLPALSWDFLTQDPPQFGGPGGGIRSAIIGTFMIVLAALIATPLGVLIALYLVEFAGPGSRCRTLRLALDLMQGLPTVVVGLFVLGLIVSASARSPASPAAVALAIMMLPLIARSSQEVLLLVPGSLREAATRSV